MNTPHDDIALKTFEEALRELEDLVGQFEKLQDTMNLEKAVSAYERGLLLKQHCETKLHDAKVKIEQVTAQIQRGESILGSPEKV